MNNFNVFVKNENGIFEPQNCAVFPFNEGILLDERLNESYITLVGCTEKVFEPLTEFRIDLIENVGEETQAITSVYYLVANDRSFEQPVGSGRYKHQVYLIERTKMLEMFVCDSITFTNTLGNTYTLGEVSRNHFGTVGFEQLGSSFRYINRTGSYNTAELMVGDTSAPMGKNLTFNLNFSISKENNNNDVILWARYGWGENELYEIKRFTDVRVNEQIQYTAQNSIMYVELSNSVPANGSITLTLGDFSVTGDTGVEYGISFITAPNVDGEDIGGKQFSDASAFDAMPIVYKSPIKVGEPMVVFSLTDISKSFLKWAKQHDPVSSLQLVESYSPSSVSDEIVSQIEINNCGEITVITDLTECPVITVKDPVTITYTEAFYGHYGFESAFYIFFKFRYTLRAVENKYPVKRLTITDCINRILELAEPIYEGQTPRFTLNPEQKTLLDKIFAPEFTMTQCTLREQLKVIGGFINAEPRLDENNIIWFDDYGGIKISTAENAIYSSFGVSQDINQYCSEIDTSAQNLINALDYAQGVLVEPDGKNYISLRTESINVRIDENDGIVATQSPIYIPRKVMCGVFDKDTDTFIIPPIDITAYVFEEHEYRANLSSYDDKYPTSKAYAIYYTQGEKGLKGLFFKVKNAISPAFKNYAIVNILSTITGKPISVFNNLSYPLFSFQISYQPIYNTRFVHGKQYTVSRKKHSAIIYNQSENLIETKYYGENIKGITARLGNVEMEKTYFFPKLSDVPKVGELFDEDYYISAVSISFMPLYIKCTIGLSKDFNRLSEYVGISSNKRVYEISEKQAYARNRVFTEYVVIGDSEPTDNASCLGMKAMTAIRDVFLQEWNLKPITSVTAWGGTKKFPIKANSELDITSRVDAKITDDHKGIIFTIANATGNEVNIAGQLEYGINGQTSTFSFTTRAVSYTYNAAVGNNLIVKILNYTAIEIVKISPLPCVKLPVISSAMGNVMTFSWNYKDNYSAGEQSVYEADENISGFWQTDYAYGDYYGRMYYYNFDMNVAQPYTEEAQKKYALAFPAGNMPKQSNMWFSTLEHEKSYLIRKDSREILQINAQIEFVTNRKDLIIGSALASSCAMVRGSDPELKPLLYVFPERLNKFINHVEGKMDVDLNQMTGIEVIASNPTASGFILTSAAFPSNGKSWAIVTKQTHEIKMVEDDDGKVISQTVYKGGDVLLACNTDVVAGLTIGNIVFTAKHRLI